MIRGAFEWPWLIMATTLSLSHQNCRPLPENSGYHRAQATTIGKKLLPLDTDATLPAEVHAPWPSALKPFATKITTKTDRTRRVGKQFEVGGRCYSGIKKKGPTVPLVKKYLPHGNVPREFAVQADMMKTARDPRVRLIIRCRNIRPGTTTLQANWRVPIRDWSSTRRADRRDLKDKSKSNFVQFQFRLTRCTSKHSMNGEFVPLSGKYFALNGESYAISTDILPAGWRILLINIGQWLDG